MKRKKKDIDWVIKNYMKFFKQFGMEEENIRSYFDTWKKKFTAGSANDYLWFLFNLLIDETAKANLPTEKMYRHMQDIYLEMCMYLRKIEGKSGNLQYREMLRYRVELELLTSPYKQTVKCVSSGCCNYCDSFDGKLFTPEEVLEHEYLGDPKKCSREGGCICLYTTRALRDKDGRIILR